MTKSALQIARASYVPKIPAVFKGNIQIKEGEQPHRLMIRKK